MGAQHTYRYIKVPAKPSPQVKFIATAQSINYTVEHNGIIVGCCVGRNCYCRKNGTNQTINTSVDGGVCFSGIVQFSVVTGDAITTGTGDSAWHWYLTLCYS